MPVDPSEPVVTTLVCLFLSHTRLRVQRAPGIPCALCFMGERLLQKLGRIAPRECGVVFELSPFPVQWLHPSRRAQTRAPQDEVLDPHGEERGNAARLAPRGQGRHILLNSKTQNRQK